MRQLPLTMSSYLRYKLAVGPRQPVPCGTLAAIHRDSVYRSVLHRQGRSRPPRHGPNGQGTDQSSPKRQNQPRRETNPRKHVVCVPEWYSLNTPLDFKLELFADVGEVYALAAATILTSRTLLSVA